MGIQKCNCISPFSPPLIFIASFGLLRGFSGECDDGREHLRYLRWCHKPRRRHHLVMIQLPLKSALVLRVRGMWHYDLRLVLYLRRWLLIYKARYLIGHILSLNVFISIEDHFKFQISLGRLLRRLLHTSGAGLFDYQSHRWHVWHLIINIVNMSIIIFFLRSRWWLHMFQIVYPIAPATEYGLKRLFKLDLEVFR